jgi:hypothetical protein
MKSVFEEYGLFIVEFIVAACIVGIFGFMISKLGFVMDFFAGQIIGG